VTTEDQYFNHGTHRAHGTIHAQVCGCPAYLCEGFQSAEPVATVNKVTAYCRSGMDGDGPAGTCMDIRLLDRFFNLRHFASCASPHLSSDEGHRMQNRSSTVVHACIVFLCVLRVFVVQLKITRFHFASLSTSAPAQDPASWRFQSKI
jgi:hypothetical protein